MVYKNENNLLDSKKNTENIVYTKKKDGKKRKNNRLKLYDEELGNSSFSLEKKYLVKKYRKSKKKHINKKNNHKLISLWYFLLQFDIFHL